MECMAIGGPNGNNPLANLFKNNATSGVAPKNQTEQVSSTEETSVDNTSKSAGRIAQLRAETLGDVFGTVGADAVAKTAGASSPIASTAIKFNETSGITATSALGEPSSVTAINNPVFGGIAASGNSETAFANQQLLLAANMSQAGGISGDFQVATANAELEKDHRLLASVG
jgi:hypothetical protein